MLGLMIRSIRSGAWLTRERLRAYPLLLGLGLAAALLFTVFTRSGPLDQWGRPLGTDFSQVWVAGLEVNAGHAAQPYDNLVHAAAQAAAFGPSDSFYSWPYPPYFLAVASLAALLPYLAALALWQGTTLLFYGVTVLRAFGPTGALRKAIIGTGLAFPAVTINILHGHNGFLTAALLGGGALLLPKRPLLAGLLLGLLAYKPQFALAVPVALVAGGLWRGLAATAVTVVMATVATLWAFGIEPWQAFLASTAFTRHVVLEQGAPGFGKMQSAFAAVRLLGGSISWAYGVQAAMTVGVLMALAWLWHGRGDHRLKLAGLMTASLLTTPYCMDYDMVVLGPVLAALVSHGLERGFHPFGKSILALVWVMPLFARAAATTAGLPLGLIAMSVLFWHIIALVRADALLLERCEKTTMAGLQAGRLL